MHEIDFVLFTASYGPDVVGYIERYCDNKMSCKGIERKWYMPSIDELRRSHL